MNGSFVWVVPLSLWEGVSSRNWQCSCEVTSLLSKPIPERSARERSALEHSRSGHIRASHHWRELEVIATFTFLLVEKEFTMKPKVCILLLSLVAWHPNKLPAVSINEGGYGQTLIFPFFSAAQGNASLITIANDVGESPSDFADPSAVKIRLLGRVDGAELASFNVYLGGRDTWVAAIHKSDGETAVSTPDASCIFPSPDGEFLTAISEEIGSIEVIQMGTVSNATLLDEINANDCASIEARWTDGPWDENPEVDLVPPVGSLRGSLTLIHVEKGTAYSVPALALADFSDIIQHTNVGAGVPNLSSVHDEGTDTSLGTSSTVCTGGDCIVDYWADPIDALAAVLTTRELHGTFVVDEALAAESEWVISYPTLKYSNATAQANVRVSLLLQDRNGNGSMVQPCIPEDPAPYACQSSYRLLHSEVIEVVSFGKDVEDFNQPAVSAISGIPFVIDFPRENYAPVPPSGTARLGFEGALVHESGRAYLGAPVLGVELQEYTNAFLESEAGNTQRANYGTAIQLSEIVVVEDL